VTGREKSGAKFTTFIISGGVVEIYISIFTFIPCIFILSKFFIHQLMHK